MMHVVRKHHRQAGIALVLVLWILTLLSVIAGGVAFSARTETLSAGNQMGIARANAIVEGAIYRAIYEMSKSTANTANGWMADGRTYDVEFDDVVVKVIVSDEAAFIDLNAAPAMLLRSLFISVGVSEQEADALVDAIQDWRDADELARTNGAERDQYEAAGLAYVPTNMNFFSVDELARVMGMTPALFQRVNVALTVHSGEGSVDSVSAPREVLLAFPNATPEEVDAYIELRSALRADNQPVPPFPLAGAPRSRQARQGGVYNFSASVVMSDGVAVGRQAVVRISADPKRPYSILDWKQTIPNIDDGSNKLQNEPT